MMPLKQETSVFEVSTAKCRLLRQLVANKKQRCLLSLINHLKSNVIINITIQAFWASNSHQSSKMIH